MEKNFFAITTLTCNNRKTIFNVIHFLFQNSSLPVGTEWFILMQGCSDIHITEVQLALIRQLDNGISRQLNTSHVILKNQSITIHLLLSPINHGLSHGMNIVNVSVREFKYVLLLEDDWVILPNKLLPEHDQFPLTWLNILLDFLQYHRSVSTLFLRR